MYYVVYGLLYGLSLLPLRVLYLLSDLAYFLIYHVTGYRKKVVMGNLAIAFPHKTEEERRVIAKKFYRNFTDSFIETLKLFSASKAFIDKHIQSDYSLFDKALNEGRKCQVHLGHFFNWEMGNLATGKNTKQKFIGVYMPLASKVMDRAFITLRARTGSIMVPATNMRSAMYPYRNEIYALGLIADQSPANHQSGFWVRFFGRPTSFLKAPEGGARIGNLPVIFCHLTKIKRGYYYLHFNIGAWEPATLPKGELTRQYVRFLEKVITDTPEMWLWSHRRWKIEWKEEYGKVIE